jgi:hypothetical protein
MPPFGTPGGPGRAPGTAAVPPAVPLDPSVPALVLRLDRNPFHHGTLGAVRSLGRAGVEVHAVVESAASPVARSRHLRRAHPAVPGPDGPEALVELLLRVSDRIGRRAVLIAMDDCTAVHTAREARRLAGRFLLPAQPPRLPGRLADKAELARLCAAEGIPHPETVVPTSPAEAVAAVRRLGLPLVAKWSRPWLLPAAAGHAGLRSTTLVRTAAEVRALYERGGGAGNLLLLQRYLPDSPESDWFFHGCFGGPGPRPDPETGTAAGAGRPVWLAGGSGRKELSWPPGTGLTAMGRWLPSPGVEAVALRLAARTGYRGILDLDFRRDPASGTPLLLDANPRPGAQFRLFTGPGGLDVVRALYLDLTGQPVPPRAEVPGRVFVAENYAPLSALLSVRGGAGRPRPGGRAHGPRGAGVETAWFAGDDPLPFLAMTGAWLGRGAVKGLRGLRPPLRPPLRPAGPGTESGASSGASSGVESGTESGALPGVGSGTGPGVAPGPRTAEPRGAAPEAPVRRRPGAPAPEAAVLPVPEAPGIPAPAVPPDPPAGGAAGPGRPRRPADGATGSAGPHVAGGAAGPGRPPLPRNRPCSRRPGTTQRRNERTCTTWQSSARAPTGSPSPPTRRPPDWT